MTGSLTPSCSPLTSTWLYSGTAGAGSSVTVCSITSALAPLPLSTMAKVTDTAAHSARCETASTTSTRSPGSTQPGLSVADVGHSGMTRLCAGTAPATSARLSLRM